MDDWADRDGAESRGDDTRGRRQLEHENEQLRQRVAELERRLSRFREDRDAALGASHAERHALWLEAERIAHVGTWVWNVATNEVQWSDEMYRILGYDPEVDEASSEAFFARLHPGDRERMRRIGEKIAETGVSEQAECRILRPDGSTRLVSTDSAVLFDDAGALGRIVGTLRDYTEGHEVRDALRVQTERLEDAAVAAKLGWYRYEIASGGLWFSPSLQQMLGSDTADVSLEAVLELLDAQSARDALVELTRGTQGEQPRPVQANATLADGSVVDVYCVSALEVGADGLPAALRGVVLDVTERASLERRLRNAEKMEALGQLSAGVAHDFNNLLTVILGSAARLRGDEPSEELDDILEAAKAAARLTANMLSFSRQAVLEPRVVDVHQTIGECMSLIRRALGENIEIRYTAPAKGLHVHIDAGQLHQIVMNMAVNARDAMPDGGTFSVACREVDVTEEDAQAHDVEAGPFVEVTLQDSGLGMNPETLKRIYEPFFTTKEPGKGTGLGLASAFGAARQNGGYIEASSVVGEGTRFRVLLPATTSAAATLPEQLASPDSVARRILLVEDEASVRRVVARMLRDEGHQVTACESPAEAIAVWRQTGGFDLLVTDFVMPEMNGVELIHELRADCPEIPALVLSGWGFQSKDVADLGRVQALQKPFDRQEMLDAVHQLCAG